MTHKVICCATSHNEAEMVLDDATEAYQDWHCPVCGVNITIAKVVP